jgi:AcrR family transcriptional regulator
MRDNDIKKLTLVKLFGMTSKLRATSAGAAGPKPTSIRKARMNKHGQALGRKGQETRQRLMDAARRLLVDQSPMGLAAVSVAKEAETSSATFYIYFNDVREIIHALSEAASAEFAEVRLILEEDWDPTVLDVDHAKRVVESFNAVWNRHRDVLRFRNLEADRGDRDFLEQRIRSSIRIIERFVDRIMASYAHGQLPSRGEAFAEATGLFAAMEGLAETDPVVVEEWRIGSSRLTHAVAKLLARSFGARQPLGMSARRAQPNTSALTAQSPDDSRVAKAATTGRKRAAPKPKA